MHRTPHFPERWLFSVMKRQQKANTLPFPKAREIITLCRQWRSPHLIFNCPPVATILFGSGFDLHRSTISDFLLTPGLEIGLPGMPGLTCRGVGLRSLTLLPVFLRCMPSGAVTTRSKWVGATMMCKLIES